MPEQNPLFQSRKRNILTGLRGKMFRFLLKNHKVIFDYLFKSSYMPV